MRYGPILALGLTALTTTGCVESVKPPFAPEDVVFEPALVGEWVDYGGQERGDLPPADGRDKATHRFERTGGGAYRSVALGGEKEASEFTVFKLGDRYFLTSKGNEGRFGIQRLTISGDCLKGWLLNVEEAVDDGNPPKCRRGDFSTTVLTGSTDEVRAFLAKHADDPGVWDRKHQVLMSKNGLKVTPAGLTGRKQRTLDYWTELRLILQDPAPHRIPRSKLALMWTCAKDEIGFLATDGVDADAVAGGSLATDLCNVMEAYAWMLRAPGDPLAALIRETTGGTALDQAPLPAGREKVLAEARAITAKLEAVRKKLSERYKSEFLPIR